jgi:hypothetical protein
VGVAAVVRDKDTADQFAPRVEERTEAELLRQEKSLEREARYVSDGAMGALRGSHA